jgi:predicted RNase H-like HicB family nuclease
MTTKPNKNLTPFARRLRSNMTDSEIVLCSRLRKKQIHNVQFYRQKPIGNYIIDFYAPAIKLVIEIDGSQLDGFTVNLLQEEEGEWLAHFIELPNVSAYGDTANDAVRELAIAWQAMKESYQVANAVQ